jgi:dihydroorotate dehydrogenase
VAVNVSSPNTARLRELQDRDGLQRILGTLLEERVALQERHGKRVPLLVKVAPDLSEAQVSDLAQQLTSLQPDGVIATNTSSDLNVLGKPAAEHRGGLSGTPLHPLSVKVISQLRTELGADFPIIGVGGIVSAANARETLRAGANLLQVYTGFAYRGTDLLDELIGAPE